jgi:FlaA1/EpsC-like NDP-sugar epimerase
MLLERRSILCWTAAVGDSLVLTSALGLSCAVIARAFDRTTISFIQYKWLLVPILAFWLVSLWLFGLYRSASYVRFNGLFSRLLQAHLLASLCFLSSMYLTKSESVSRLLLQLFVAFALAALVIEKCLVKATIDYLREHHHAGRRRVLLVATNDHALSYMDFVRRHSSMNAEIVGFVEVDNSSDYLLRLDDD